MVKKLPFKEFIELYLSPKTLASSRSSVPMVLNDKLFELPSYELLLDDGEGTVVGHPDYLEAGLPAYVRFTQDMQRAFKEKKPS